MPTVEPYGYPTVPGQSITLYGTPIAANLTNPVEELRMEVSCLRNEVAEIKGMLTAVLIALGGKQ